MRSSHDHDIVLFSTPEIAPLADSVQQKLVALLGQDVGQSMVDYDYFLDGAPKMLVTESVRWKSVILLMDLFNHLANASGDSSSLNDRYMVMRWLIKTIKDFGAEQLSLILPSFPYARDDAYDANGCAETKKRKPNLAHLAVSDMISHGLDHVITVDLHNDVILNRGGQTNFINLSVWWMFRSVLERLWLDTNNVVLSGTDAGGKKKISAISKDLHINHITTLKERDYRSDQKIEKVVVYGDCVGKDVLLYDDMIDTGGTLMAAIAEIQKAWAQSVHVIVTHSMLHGDSITELQQLFDQWIIQSFTTTDSIAHADLPDRCTVLSIDTLLANTMSSLLHNESVDYNNGLILAK